MGYKRLGLLVRCDLVGEVPNVEVGHLVEDTPHRRVLGGGGGCYGAPRRFHESRGDSERGGAVSACNQAAVVALNALQCVIQAEGAGAL